jgi:NCS1 family nucleobase:cation symporter-1
VNIYNCGFILSFAAGASVYLIGCKVFPPRIYPSGHEHENKAWEHMRLTEGFFVDDDILPEYIRERFVEGSSAPSLVHGNGTVEKV